MTVEKKEMPSGNHHHHQSDGYGGGGAVCDNSGLLIIDACNNGDYGGNKCSNSNSFISKQKIKKIRVVYFDFNSECNAFWLSFDEFFYACFIHLLIVSGEICN